MDQFILNFFDNRFSSEEESTPQSKCASQQRPI